MRNQNSMQFRRERELRTYRRVCRQQELFRKCITLLMTACFVIICAFSYHSINTSAHTGEEDINFKYYTSITVAYGETLWDIADNYIDYTEYRNKGEYIAEVKSINHLNEECAIRAGQDLIIPYYSKKFVK